ncbi:hypothetical protein [Deinococcus cavernae]|uniref:hypothetical protein n=1 Tax=Deinococcus cavernae TaxID=2320857 RepID=UPI0011C21466|nr:hypothetical protein [Deinococcus cavernae]
MSKSNAVTKVQLRITGSNLRVLKQQAEAENLSVYNYGGDLLERALNYASKEASDELLAPHIRRAVRQEVDRMLETLTELLLRVYMEAGTGRRLTQAGLMLPTQMPREKVLDLTEKNWDNTYRELRDDVKGISDWRKLLMSGQGLKPTESPSHAEEVAENS